MTGRGGHDQQVRRPHDDDCAVVGPGALQELWNGLASPMAQPGSRPHPQIGLVPEQPDLVARDLRPGRRAQACRDTARVRVNGRKAGPALEIRLR